MTGPYRIRPAELRSAPRRGTAPGAAPARRDEARARAAELQQRPAGCFLLTGYRGVGKSSFVSLLAALAEQESAPFLFVEVNGAVAGGEEERPRFLLRKMQRTLYETLRERGFLERLPRPLRMELHMAYLQTGNTVQNTTKVTWKMDAGLERKNWIARSSLTLLGAGLLEALPFLPALGLKAVVGWAGRWAFGVPYWLAAALLPALFAFLTPTLHLKWSRSGEQAMVTRYDDEVAENSFIRLLERLAQPVVLPESRWRRAGRAWESEADVALLTAVVRAQGVPGSRLGMALLEWGAKLGVAPLKAAVQELLAPGPSRQRLRLVFVIDELDKLGADRGDKAQRTAEFDALVRGLKPVLLCGQAHFLLICGMEDFYRWYQGTATEDDAFVNLFSGHMHVAAMSETELRELFRGLLAESARAEDPVLRQFCDALILRSRGRPRQFLNEFARYVRWEGEPALALTDQAMEAITLDAALARALEQVWAAVSTWKLEGAISDMLRTRALLWIQEMLRQEQPFAAVDIWREEDFAERAEQDYRKEALDILDALLAAMADGQLLQRRAADGRCEWLVNPRASSLEAGLPGAGSQGAWSQGAEPASPPGGSEPVVAVAGSSRLQAVLSGEGERQLVSTLRSWGWRPDGSKSTASRGEIQPDLAFIDPDGRSVWVECKFAAGSGLSQAQLDFWIEGLVSLAVWRPDCLNRGLRIILVIAGAHASSAALLRSSRRWEMLPLQIDVAFASDLEPSAITAALRSPAATFGLPAGAGGLSAEAGDGFAVLHWQHQPGQVFRLMRSTRPGDMRAVEIIAPDQPGRFTDINLTNEVPYFYTLMTDDARPVASVSVTPSPNGRSRDGGYWQAVMRSAANRTTTESERRIPLPSPQSLGQYLESGRLNPASINALREAFLAMGLAATDGDGSLRLTAAGIRAAGEYHGGGQKPTLLAAVLQHPALAELLKQLKEQGRLTLPLKERSQEEWLHYLAQETGALRIAAGEFTWAPVEAPAEGGAPA